MKAVVIVLAVVCGVIAALVGFDVLSPDKPADAQQLYNGFLALAVTFGFGSALVP
jgi:hypothetical protein